MTSLVLPLLSIAILASGQPITVHLVGDSTMAEKPLEANPERGWGQAFSAYFDDRVIIANHAQNGRSTQSFIDEGRWDAVLRALRPGDYVFIQFGHNDEKHADPQQYAHTGFKQNLERYVRETRERGGQPVLLTPVMRRRFDEQGRFFDTHGDYPDVVRQVAREGRVPLLDLHRSTERLIVDQGAEGSKKLFLWIEAGRYATCPSGRQDDTHFSEYGARRLAGLVADGLRQSRLPLKKRLRKEPAAPSTVPVRAYLFSYFVGNGEDGLHLAVSHDALNWTSLKGGRSFLTPAAGRDRLMRDPFIFQGPDGLFHLTWTVRWTEKAIGYATSRDLIQWSEQRTLGVMEHEPSARNCWAPEMIYDEEHAQYVVFWSTTIPGRFPQTDGQARREPEAPGWNHRLYAASSKDMQALGETRLFFDQGFNVIDASIVKDDSRYVMFLKDETDAPFTPQKNLRVTTAPSLDGPWTPVSSPITGDYWAEGPSPLKVGDRWIVYFDRYREKRYGAVVSRTLETWEDASDQVHFPPGARHGTVFRASQEILDRLLAVE